MQPVPFQPGQRVRILRAPSFVPAHLQGEVAVVSTPSPLGFAGLTEICVPRSGELYVVENSALRPVGGRSAR